MDIIQKLTELADRWDADLQREYNIGEDYTDWHARELREILSLAS